MVTHCIGKECFSSPGVSLFNNGGSPMPCLDMFWWKSLIVNISQAYNLMHMKCKDFIMRECTNIFMLEGIFHYGKKLPGPKWTNTGYKHKKYWCAAFLSKHDFEFYDVIKLALLRSNNRSFFQRVLKVLCRQKWQPWSAISSSMVAGSKFKFQKNYRNYLFQLSLILNTLFPLMLSNLTLKMIFHKLRTLCSRSGGHELEWK